MQNRNENVFDYISTNSKKIIVYGAGIVARAVVITLKVMLETPERIRCCAVTNLNHNPRFVEDIRVENFDSVDKFNDDIIVIAVKEMYYQDVLKNLESHGFFDYWTVSQDKCISVLKEKWMKKHCRIASEFIVNKFDENLSKEEYLTFLSRQLNENYLNFEVNLADHCNLNCQCCNHFSPIAKPRLLDIEEYRRDISRLSEILNEKVGTIMLLGGEPLLHPQIEQIMSITREAYRNADISIVSNGMLLNKMNDSFWKSCHEYDIGLLLTKYPVNFDYSIWVEEAKKRRVRLSFTLDSIECKTTYKLPLELNGGVNPYNSYAKCYHANKCVVLKSGRLYTCPIAAYICHFNSFFGMDLPEENTNSIDIYSSNSIEEIECFLKQPIPMCEHCRIADYEYDIPWSTSKKIITEWT